MSSLDDSILDSSRRRPGLLREQVQPVKRKDSNRYEMLPIPGQLSFEKGFFVVIRACQMLVQKNDGIIFVGIAGPSGAGKSFFTERVVNFMPSVAVISMDNYNDASRIIDGNFDDPRLTDYDTLLENIKGLKNGHAVQVPVYDFKTSNRTGYRTVEVPSSHLVIIEGIYALSEKLRPLLDLRVSVTGGVHFDLVKRVLRDIQRAGQEPEEIIQQISETVYPMYKAFIEPDLLTAHIKIINKFNPFSGFQNPTYILKSPRELSDDQIRATANQIRAVMSKEHKESTEEMYDIYLLPPGEDPEACQSYLRMRNREGKYNLIFEEYVTDFPFIISPRITFEVSVRLLGGLMALGYTFTAILKRSSRVFTDEHVIVKIDWLEQLKRHYIQVQGRERMYVQAVAEKLGLEGSYTPQTYIEQIKHENLKDVMAWPDDLKAKLSIDGDASTSPREMPSCVSADCVAMKNNNLKGGLSASYSTHGDENTVQLSKPADGSKRFTSRDSDTPHSINQLSEQIVTLNERMDEVTCRMDELDSKMSDSIITNSTSHQNLSLENKSCNGSKPTNQFVSQLSNGTLLPHLTSANQCHKAESPLMEKILLISRTQQKLTHQLDDLSNLLHESISHAQKEKNRPRTRIFDVEAVSHRLIPVLAVGALGFIFCKGLNRNSTPTKFIGL